MSTDNKDIGEQLSLLGIELENLEDKRSRLIIEMKNIDENLRKLGIEVSKHVSGVYIHCSCIYIYSSVHVYEVYVEVHV